MHKHVCVSPGEILEQEFLIPFGLSQYKLAKDISVSARRINEIIHGERAITIDTAVRLARFFGTSPQLWLNLQRSYELDCMNGSLVKKIEREVRVYEPA